MNITRNLISFQHYSLVNFMLKNKQCVVICVRLLPLYRLMYQSMA